MGSVIDYIECPNCKNEAFSDFYYKTGEEYVYCENCGYKYSALYRRDGDGKLVTSDGTKNFSFDNLIMDIHETKNPYGAGRVKYQGSLGYQTISIDTKEDYDKFVSEVISFQNQENDIEFCSVSRLIEGSIVKEVLIGDIYYFDDWVSDMLNSSDYEEKDLLEFEEYYQNLLSFDENTEVFINQLKNN